MAISIMELRTASARIAKCALIALFVVLSTAISGPCAESTEATSVTPQLTTAIPLNGTFHVINDSPGDQIDPQVDCSLASYTNDTGSVREVHYFDFATNSDATVPTIGLAFLSDVSGSRIVYTNVTGADFQIGVFDTGSSSSSLIPDGNQRTSASIGGALVAFEDRSFFPDPSESEIMAYDLEIKTTTRLTNNTVMDTDPQVSPNGKVVVFQECQTNGFGCDIYESIQSSGWTTINLTAGNGGENAYPHTDGSTVVYASTRSGETDIYYQPVGGGPETQLAIPGDQRNPRISVNLISFESQVGTEYDIFVYDMISRNLYQVTNTPVDEVHSDLSVCNGVGRITYSAPGPNGDYDVFGFTFQPSIPFSSFSGQLDASRSTEQFDLNGSFTLGAGSKIHPLWENITLQVGPYSVALAAGSFTQIKKGAYVFQGSVNGVSVQIKITPLGASSYTIQAQGSGANLTGVTDPVAVTLTIGNDSGTKSINAQLT